MTFGAQALAGLARAWYAKTMATPSVRPLVTLTLSVLTGCAMSPTMPPFGVARSTVIAPAPVEAHGLPAARPFVHRKRIARQYDAATDQTRVSVTTHRGTYFLWVQHPQLTFFYEHPGAASAAHPPASVFLVFRTQNPQLPQNNRLSMVCDGASTELTITPSFWVEPLAFTSNRHYMYELSLDQLAQVAACHSVTLAVGDVSAPFNGEQLEALRDFAAGVVAR
jgi:hypothetical protein